MSEPHISLTGRTAFEVARAASEEAGAILLEHFRSVTHVKHKGKRDIQTEVDLLSEKIITGILRSEFPDDGIVTEESAAHAGSSGYNWIIDPLDGTNNYFYGLPYFAVNIALVRDASGSGTTPSTVADDRERDGEEILLGLTYAPNQKELFWAEKGKGAFVNDRPIHVTEAGELTNCLASFDMGYSQEHGVSMLEVAKALWPRVHSMRLLGSGALGLAYVASGRLGVYYHQFLYPWDVAPGILLVREAGGVVEAWGGKPITIHSGSVVAASPVLLNEFHSVIGTGVNLS